MTRVSKFFPEKYPLLLQVIDTYLVVYSPDFDYKIAEKYESYSPGQTELLLMRMRDHLSHLARRKELEGKDIPLPSSSLRLLSEFKSEFLTSREAARILRISQDTLSRMAQRGEINFKKTPGGHRRFLRSDIETHPFFFREIRK